MMKRSRVIVVAVALTAAGAAGYAVRGFIPSESAGAALRRACASILDEAAVEFEQPQPVHEIALQGWMDGTALVGHLMPPRQARGQPLHPSTFEKDEAAVLVTR